MNALMKRWRRLGPFTEAFGTPIVALLDPESAYGRIIINRLSILEQGTAHTLTVMQVLGRDKVAVGGATGQATFKILSANATGMAANDYLVIRGIDGRCFVGVVSVVGADIAGVRIITLAANLTYAVEAGAEIYFFGVIGDGHEQRLLTVSSTNTFESEYGYFGANQRGEPMLLHIGNATAAATIQAVVCPTIDA